MRIVFVIALSVCVLHTSAQNAYERAWQQLNANKWDEAAKLLKDARQDPATRADAFITSIYMESYRGKESGISDFVPSFYNTAANPYPYIYALWFNESVAGGYKKKNLEFQLTLLNKLLSDAKAPGTLVAAANYQLGKHFEFANEMSRAQRHFDAVGNIRNWQFTGPFENLSKSGYYKNYGPLDRPGPDAEFKSLSNASIKWFAPTRENRDGWTPVSFHINHSTAVVYAQNFVQSASEQEVYCNVGASGSVKVWINDELVIAEPQERETELDTYTVKCTLKKGVNRILVQLGYTRHGYPNFTLRFTDDKFRPLNDITGSSSFAAYPKAPTPHKKHELIEHFAEQYFRGEIARHPSNLLNYILLADVYLRSKKVMEARNLISEALEKAPNNCLLRMKMVDALIKEDNRTLLLEEVDKLKQLDPESLLVMELNIKEHFGNQKYDEGAKELEKRIRLYGEDENTGYYKLLILIQEEKYEELIQAVESMHQRYPTNTRVLEMMYMIKANVNKDRKGALKLYENFMKSNFDYEIFMKYVEVLEEQGDNGKALDLKKKLAEYFPYSPLEFSRLSSYYYNDKKYDKAEEYIRQSLALSPYNEDYWEQLGDVLSEKKATQMAVDAYNKSLQFDPNKYTIINKIRKMEGKAEMYKLLGDPDIDAIVREDKITDAKNTDYGYYYVLDQKDVIAYPGGAAEEYYSILIRLTNDKGVSRYKESSIDFDNSQSLLIEKAQVIKKNGAKIEGEKNENVIVFTNLEPGDIIHFKYRLRNFQYGRLAKEFWDKYYFGGQIYSAAVRYRLLIPTDRKFSYHMEKMNSKPEIKQVENYTMYTWENLKATPDKDEPLMPGLTDMSAVLHLSSIPEWKVISDWYADICNNNAEEDFEIISLYKKLFPDEKKKLTQFEKGRIIYNYIQANIRYSSVSFRQSAYVPQRPSTTLVTRLGDCKDLSSLFVTLARMAGIPAQMVLVDTKDNGLKNMILPSVEFNHCIVKAELDGKKYYIELTNNYLPFASLPNNLNGANILEIPFGKTSEKPELKSLKSETRTKDVVRRTLDFKPNGTDLEVSVRTAKYGHLSSYTRDTYAELDMEKQLKEMEESVASSYKNNVKVSMVRFTDLDKLNDSVVYSYQYKVKNEISEIGSMKTFRITYPDIVASLDNFSAETRTYPILYSAYEDTDEYETVVTVTAPTGMKFVELPTSENLVFKNLKYSLQYQLKAPDKLVITRKFTNDRKDIPASDYEEFRTFFEKIVKAEQKFIAYK